ncbi:tRNA (guanosine(37)-N1)-methyltransferase TrmD [Nakamurella flavida]|uniref:tRNA (guanine-N(1)-)-methyltransferase n=1 Tax=Nakamurella flavida TaxID=363630 RepID=A0A938YMW0_9ACTN|nr:tRNA (guanosine(37)-N1)-methyltransferase TrmD [Nakamurella flavida]MBM9476134.1 tRNA (guanosine(37)-N1)-methyltransferase TrmD [Nakamurella flavida]MDP9777121.1 tRNA (guanine37-N1)-methyltransferase [Nakamurella flavida]
MRIDVITLFPEYLDPLRASLVGRAQQDGRFALAVHDLRQFATDRHRTVDDSPYGGGAGMVMRADVWGRALDAVAGPDTVLVVPTPAGERLDQTLAAELAGAQHLVFACGRYEGIDQRVADVAAETMAVREISIGDYVLAGGEVAVLVMVEAVARLLPGVLGNPESAVTDSFGAGSPGLLEHPQYTRPPVYRGRPIPAVLTSGDHAAVARWQRDESLRRTARRRPDLLAVLDADTLDEADVAVLVAEQVPVPEPALRRAEESAQARRTKAEKAAARRARRG